MYHVGIVYLSRASFLACGLSITRALDKGQ